MPKIPERKHCKACGKFKDVDTKNFFFRKGKPLARCKECVNKRRRSRELVRRNPIQVYDHPQVPANFEELFEKQGGLCAMCHCKETVREANGELRELTYFHNDILGVYGLLDHNCSLMCQAAQDNPKLALLMAIFLTSGIFDSLDSAHRARAKLR